MNYVSRELFNWAANLGLQSLWAANLFGLPISELAVTAELSPQLPLDAVANRSLPPQVCHPKFATPSLPPQVCHPKFATPSLPPQVCHPKFATPLQALPYHCPLIALHMDNEWAMIGQSLQGKS
ncbi:MAG: hypothetical protein PHY48_11945 [Candidatus Cloacimonetes bacterium]|nr:hypothetical protein [Candidatus Cloacimonadota bacterium]